MADLSHLPWPYHLGTDVEQLSDEELLASAAVIASTPRGHRDDLPSFGVTSLVFQQEPLDLETFAAELANSDDRLNVDADELLDLAAATVSTVRAAISAA